MALLCVHRLNLPLEILCIIKDFAFISVERKRIMDYHKFIHAIVINNAKEVDNWDGCNSFRWSENYKTHRQFFFDFCTICGNYICATYSLSEFYRGYPSICSC